MFHFAYYRISSNIAPGLFFNQRRNIHIYLKERGLLIFLTLQKWLGIYRDQHGFGGRVHNISIEIFTFSLVCNMMFYYIIKKIFNFSSKSPFHNYHDDVSRSSQCVRVASVGGLSGVHPKVHVAASIDALHWN